MGEEIPSISSERAAKWDRGREVRKGSLLSWLLPGQGGGGPVSLGIPKKPCRMSPQTVPWGTRSWGIDPPTPSHPPHPAIGWRLSPRALNFPTSGSGVFWENPGRGDRQKPRLCGPGGSLTTCKCCPLRCTEAKWDTVIWHGHTKHCHSKPTL